LQELLVKCPIRLCGTFKVLEHDTPLAGKFGDLLVGQGSCGRRNGATPGFLLHDGAFRALSKLPQLTRAILEPDIRTMRRLGFRIELVGDVGLGDGIADPGGFARIERPEFDADDVSQTNAVDCQVPAKVANDAAQLISLPCALARPKNRVDDLPKTAPLR